jgi:sterol desaturase/sphingolipid hydroxylase (fatty acid hydroxylase superfamily)
VKKKDLLFLMVLFVLLSGIFIITLGYPPRARFFPIIVIALCGILVLWEFVKAYKKEGNDKEISMRAKENWRPFIFAVAWIGAFTLFIWLLGFVVGLPLFVFVYVKAHEAGWKWALILPIIMFLIVYVGFAVLMESPLYEGLLFLL